MLDFGEVPFVLGRDSIRQRVKQEHARVVRDGDFAGEVERIERL